MPSATNVIAVTASSRPTVQPKCDAKSPMTAVRIPIQTMDDTKQRYPEHISVSREILVRHQIKLLEIN